LAKLKGVLFDYSHTLVWFPRIKETGLAAARNAQKVLSELGASIEPSKLGSLVVDFAHRTDSVGSMEEEFKEIFSFFGIKNYSQNDLKEIIWAWWRPFVQNVRARKGAGELLEHLKSMRLKIGIVANIWGDGMNPVLERLDIKRFFDILVASSDVGYKKPDPCIFRLALDRLELSPEEVIMVGDNPKTDIQAAHDVGMSTVRLMRGPNRIKPDVVNADFKVKNLSTVAAIVCQKKFGRAGRI